MRSRFSTFHFINGVAMILLGLICLYPLLYVVFASFSTPSMLAANRGFLYAPLGFTLEGYKILLKNPMIYTGYFNTIIYVVAGTVCSLFLTVIAAFITSRKKWMWSGPVMALITVHMFFQGGMIPFYILIRDIGLLDTRLAIILPGALSVFNLIVLRTAMLTVPESLEESARLDGASDVIILWHIILPVIKAALAVQVLFYAVGRWNEWFNAMIFLKNQNLYPLQLVLRDILLQGDMQSMAGSVGNAANPTDVNQYQDLVKYTTIVVATVPILCIYPFLQKYFVKGVMVGSIKG